MSLTKQGVRNLNGLGPKRKRPPAIEAEGSASAEGAAPADGQAELPQQPPAETPTAATAAPTDR